MSRLIVAGRRRVSRLWLHVAHAKFHSLKSAEVPLKCEQQEVVPKRFAHCSDVEVEFQGGVIAEALLPQIMEVFTAEDLYGR